MKVQQVGFNGEQLRAKGGTIPHIGHRIKAFFCDASPRDVNAVLGHKLFVTRQIDGWNGVLRSISAASPRHTQNAKRTRQQMSRAAHVPRGNQLANLRAGNGFASQAHLGIDLHFESHLAPQLGEQAHIPGSLVPKAEIESLMHLAGVQSLAQDAFGKLSRSHQRQIAPEGKHQHGVDPGTVQPAQLFRQRRQQLQPRLRLKNPRRMRLKRYRHRFPAVAPRPRYDLAQHMGMGPMHPVEISHADIGGSEIRRHLFDFAKHIHRKENC